MGWLFWPQNDISEFCLQSYTAISLGLTVPGRTSDWTFPKIESFFWREKLCVEIIGKSVFLSCCLLLCCRRKLKTVSIWYHDGQSRKLRMRSISSQIFYNWYWLLYLSLDRDLWRTPSPWNHSDSSLSSCALSTHCSLCSPTGGPSTISCAIRWDPELLYSIRAQSSRLKLFPKDPVTSGELRYGWCVRGRPPSVNMRRTVRALLLDGDGSRHVVQWHQKESALDSVRVLQPSWRCRVSSYWCSFCENQ